METKILLLIIILLLAYIIYNNCYSTQAQNNITEGFGPNITDADISAIRNLNGIASTLMQPNGTITNPGNLKVAGTITSPTIDSINDNHTREIALLRKQIKSVNDNMNKFIEWITPQWNTLPDAPVQFNTALFKLSTTPFGYLPRMTIPQNVLPTS